MKKIIFCYDFDKTLTKEDMLDYGFSKKINRNPALFWEEEKAIMKQYGSEKILAGMLLKINLAKENNIPLTRDSFVEFGKELEFFEGVDQWFDLVNKLSKQHNMQVEHYVISAGMYPSIEGSKLFPYFKKVYACEYMYDANNNAFWPAVVIDKANKSYYIDQIAKAENIDVKDMVYFGDGGTDIPAFEYVAKHGGISIAVQHPIKQKEKVLSDMLKNKTLTHYVDANYTEKGPLFKIVKQHLLETGRN